MLKVLLHGASLHQNNSVHLVKQSIMTKMYPWSGKGPRKSIFKVLKIEVDDVEKCVEIAFGSIAHIF